MTSNPPKREKEIFPKYFNTTSYIHTECLVSVTYTLILGAISDTSFYSKMWHRWPSAQNLYYATNKATCKYVKLAHNHMDFGKYQYSVSRKDKQ